MSSDVMESLAGQVEEVINNHLRTFLRWAKQNWRMDEQAIADPTFSDNSDDWFDGYNAAIESLEGALDCWLEEYP